MALQKFDFQAIDMGNSSEATTNYTIEIVDCSNTANPIVVNGYTFKTVLTGQPKSGVVNGEFTNVPNNTTIPANTKLKITGIKNGQSVIKYAECNASSTLICQSTGDGHLCSVTQVTLSSPTCQVGGVQVPYTFRTDETGIYNVILIFVGSTATDNLNQQTVYPDYTVNNINILQTGSINLTTINSGFYKLQIGKKRSDGTYECIGTSQATYLACGDQTTCTNPTFTVNPINPTCGEINPNSDAKIGITNVVNGNKVRFCKGNTFTCNNDYATAITISNNQSFIVAEGLSLTEAQETYTVRVYKDQNCYQDKNVTLSKPNCVVDFCSFTANANNEQVVKTYQYTNAGTTAKRIYLRFDPGTIPDKFTIKRNGFTLLDTACAGSNPSTCVGVNCSQGGVICGNVQLQPNDVLTVIIDGTCSNNSVVNWSLQTSCSVISTCSTSIEYGGAGTTCGITQPATGINYECNGQSVNLTLEQYYGSVSGTYQFAVDPTRQLTVGQVSWQDSNVFTNLPLITPLNIWVRDKDTSQTTCYTTVNSTTPNCIGTAPTIAPESIQMTNTGNNFGFSGLLNNYTSQNHKLFFKFKDNATLYSGTVSSNTFTAQVPTGLFGAAQVYVVNTVTGLKSPTIDFFIYQSDVSDLKFSTEEPNIMKNQCINGVNQLLFSVYSGIGGLRPLYYWVRDYNTNAILFTNDGATEGTEPFTINHNLNQDVYVQVATKNNVFVNGLNRGRWATPIKKFRLEVVCQYTGDCDCIQIAGVSPNNYGTGTQTDGISILALLKGDCTKVKMFVEDNKDASSSNLVELGNQNININGANLASPYQEYNLRYATHGSLKYRNIPRTIKLQGLNVNNVVRKEIQFTVTLDPNNNPVATPIKRWDCTGPIDSGNSNSFTGEETIVSSFSY